MELVTQFSVFLANKPGILAQVAKRLAESKINLLAMTMMDSSEHGVLRLVAGDLEKTRDALSQLNLPLTETPVLMLEMPNKPGALADVCEKLARAHVNISYAYCTTGGRGGKARGVFKLADVKKAMKVLESPRPKTRDAKKKLRRPTTKP
jgi:hypothetical protein